MQKKEKSLKTDSSVPFPFSTYWCFYYYSSTSRGLLEAKNWNDWKGYFSWCNSQQWNRDEKMEWWVTTPIHNYLLIPNYTTLHNTLSQDPISIKFKLQLGVHFRLEQQHWSKRATSSTKSAQIKSAHIHGKIRDATVF